MLESVLHDLDMIGKEVVVGYSRYTQSATGMKMRHLYDVHPYVINRRLLFSTYIQCSYVGGKFRHIYRGNFFRKFAYIRHNLF